MARRGLHRWHRRAGVIAAGFLLYLLITGVPLQYSAALDLGGRFVTAPFVLDWYGLEAPETVMASSELIAVGEQLILDGRNAGSLDGFRGAVMMDGLLAAAGSAEVLLLGGDGATVDRFRLDTTIRRIGTLGDRVVLDTDAGLRMADHELLNWRAVASAPAQPRWARLEPVPADQAAAYRSQVRGRMLTFERLLQDLHSGRAFGSGGGAVIDAASVLLTFLAISGLIMWWRTH